MGMPDFLKKDAETPLVENYLAAGIPLTVATNFPEILQTADDCFAKDAGTDAPAGVQVRLWVDPLGHSAPPWPKPYYRGHGHLVFAGFDSQNSVLLDLRNRKVIGRLTPALAGDRTFWKTVILPMTVAIVAASAGATVLHCACVAWKGSGVLLAGGSRSGKSTLAVALAQTGFDFVSDDRTVISTKESRQLAWNLGTHLKLRAEAADLFPALRNLSPGRNFKGEEVFDLDPVQELHLPRVRCCAPRWVFFLDRGNVPEFSLTETSPEEAAFLLESGLARETREAEQQQRRVIEALAGAECWKLRYGGDPHSVARTLREFVRGRGSLEAPRNLNLPRHGTSVAAARLTLSTALR